MGWRATNTSGCVPGVADLSVRRRSSIVAMYPRGPLGPAVGNGLYGSDSRGSVSGSAFVGGSGEGNRLQRLRTETPVTLRGGAGRLRQGWPAQVARPRAEDSSCTPRLGAPGGAPRT